MKKLKAFLTIFLFVLVGIFALQNSAIVEIQFLAWGFSAPRIFIVIALLIIGFLLGLLVSNLSSLKHSSK
jgi:uncharacterized integral membrane protein